MAARSLAVLGVASSSRDGEAALLDSSGYGVCQKISISVLSGSQQRKLT